jgi:hypothetical protein
MYGRTSRPERYAGIRRLESFAQIEDLIMAHFARIDENNVVQQVIVVANKDTADADGNELESIGVAFCQKLLGGNWKQTSYHGNIRKNYAGVGYTYRADIDAFVAPQP